MRLLVRFPQDPKRIHLPGPQERRRLRRDASLTVEYAAWIVAIDPATFSRWERGLLEPRGAGRIVYAALLEELASRA